MSRSVLVVEEHPALRRAYARELGRAGYEVLAVSPHEDVEAQIAAQAPAVIVLDPHVAAGRGLAIAEAALRARPKAALVFNVSDPQAMETDFSTWMADAYAVRTRAIEDVVRAVRRIQPPDRPVGHASGMPTRAPGRPPARATATAG